MDRRTFLTRTVPAVALAKAGPLIFGLGDLLAQDERKKPVWLGEALRRMKATGRCGIVLIIPDAKDLQRPLGDSLAGLIDSDVRAAHALFAEAVFICIRRIHAEGTICEIGDQNNRYLLDPSGKRLDSDKIAPESLENPTVFAASFGPFLHGATRERLRAMAASIRKTLPESLKTAVEQLDSDDPDTRDRASALLVREADRIMPFLAELSLHAETAERRGRAADVIEASFKAAALETSGPRLPFGCKIPKLVPAGCGGTREAEENEDETKRVAVACGLGRMPRESRRFLSFLKE